MSGIPYTKELEKEYIELFSTCDPSKNRIAEIQITVKKILSNQKRYQRVSSITSVPWYVVAAIHSMESSLNFNKHLHNGDSLSKRTTHVPKGRPTSGSPPFSWEESAIDALRLKKLDTWKRWSLPGVLYKLEQYNGWGYRKYHPSVHSPYLWSFSNHYTKGKYIEDGSFSKNAVSEQCGAAVLLLVMSQSGSADIDIDLSINRAEN